ncbi:MAG: preprotein translocase subunit SecA [Bacteroidia bacterium]|jgi:preprotein translocase subunit SecA|nr:preprotein translocase subunit SecA [Bacteroidales bacterium]MDD3300453.1 preprotein translocase subunit SecA [Bacteroidales bacterium]MDD3843583.1 preprotein translocase subunit SecA [Bacteroidales bacterium]MDD4617736.1 preprotein translocase subunit SecA [Bacteroidales bacterium]NCC45918.1 preprotein translocase subunit SecA [Bacteroidia bacterium]
MALISDVLKKFFGTKSERDIKQIQPYVDKTIEAYQRIDKLSNDELRDESLNLKKIISDAIAADEQKKKHLRERLEDVLIDVREKEELATEVDKLTKKIDGRIEEVLLDILPDAFAIMKSTARRFKENGKVVVRASEFDRDLAAKHDFVEIEGDNAIYSNSWIAGGTKIVWDMVHYDVQLIGGVALHQGKIAEMATGEGKTLVATLPVFLNALAGKGVHVVTVNDYLSRRDSEWMGPLYQFHGLKVDCLDKHQPNSEARKAAYRADVTFGTNNEFGFDYLRDNMAINAEDLVQKKHHYAIVDEVDSVLIDDARTPLIISGPVPKGDEQQFNEYKPIVERLYSAQRAQVTQLLNEAKAKIKEGNEEEGGKLLLRAHKGLPRYNPLIKYLSEPGMKQILLKTENFYMQDNNKQMHLITDDLFFVIDEKQRSVELTDKGHELIAKNVSDSKFFILPDIGTEISELEKAEISPEDKLAQKDALLSDYAVKSERVHTVNQLLKAYTMFEKDVEYVVMDNKIKIVDEQTGRILEGRRYSDGLHQAIEAKESVKVEAATQTFATITLQNYFRMYHKLAGMTGTAETEAGEFWSIYKLDVVVIPTNRPIIRKDLEDMIFKTKREKYNAVIDEIVELTKKNRPVLVGTTSVEVSELLSRMLKLRGIKHNVLNAKQHAKEADIVAEAGQPGSVTIATNMAGRGTDIKLGSGVKEAGGLAIIGTERHDSRRVDRQLRGRAGRQGDPGSSSFFVSLEDDLMRLFGSERIAGLVDKMGMKDGEVLQHSMLSKSIERAQKKVEENNFGIRKRLLEYDDVMNSQREVIYTRRRNALYGERIDVDIQNMMNDYTDSLVQSSHGNIPFEEFSFETIRHLSIEPGMDQDFYDKEDVQAVSERLLESVQAVHKRRVDTLVSQSWPIIKQVYETQSATYDNIAIPVSDGSKMMQVLVNLKKAYETQGREIARSLNKSITLMMIDEYWKEHLREMDDLKQSVQNASYEQKDPLLIYKFESFKLFQTMLDKVNRDVLGFLLKAHIPLRDVQSDPAKLRQEQRRKTDLSNMQTSRTDLVTSSGEPKSQGPVHVEKKVGRNDPCPCGSGKKYKNCHGAAN